MNSTPVTNELHSIKVNTYTEYNLINDTQLNKPIKLNSLNYTHLNE